MDLDNGEPVVPKKWKHLRNKAKKCHNFAMSFCNANGFLQMQKKRHSRWWLLAICAALQQTEAREPLSVEICRCRWTQSTNQSIKIFNKQLSDCNWTYTYELHE